MGSAAFETARASSELVVAYGVELTFPAFDALPELQVRYGTTDFEADGATYDPRMQQEPTVIQQTGYGQDTADFQLNDPKAVLYDSIKSYEDVIEDTRVVIRECLFTANQIFESEIIHWGYIDRFSYDEQSLVLSIGAIADTSRPGRLVGGRVLSARYCAAFFNINGLLSPILSACGWQTAQGGNPIFCSHKMEGTDGCNDHNNPWRFFALPALTTAEVTYTTGDTGWDYSGGGGPCFHPQTGVWMASGAVRPIHMVKAGDIVMGWDDHGRPVPARVLSNHKHLVDMTMEADFLKGKLNQTAEHLFKIGPSPGVYRCIGAIDALEPFMGRYDRRKERWAQTMFTDDRLVQQRQRVHNLYVEGVHNYFVVAGDERIGVSNNKSALDPVVLNA